MLHPPQPRWQGFLPESICRMACTERRHARKLRRGMSLASGARLDTYEIVISLGAQRAAGMI